MDYSKWKEDFFDIEDLYLDKKNPRLPANNNLSLSEDEIIHELIINDKAFELVINIAEQGYFPGEHLIGVRENGKIIIVEGNRRLAACKILLNHNLLPDDYKKRSSEINSNFDLNSIKKLKVILAPTRESSLPLIVSRHTAGLIEPWEPLMQANFYFRQIEGGITVDQLSEKLNVPGIDIRKALKRYYMFKSVAALDLSIPIKIIATDPRLFGITIFERIYDNDDAKKFLGIDFDLNGKLTGKIAINEFKKGLKKIVTDIVLQKVDTRKLNKADDIKNYLLKIPSAYRPRLTKKGSFSSDDIVPIDEDNEDSDFVVTRRSKRTKTKKQKGIIPDDIVCTVNNTRIKDVFKELKDISHNDFPTATGMLLRCLLEISISYYLTESGHVAKMKKKEEDKLAKKIPMVKIRKHWSPDLMPMLNYIIDNEIIGNGKITKSLSRSVREHQDIFTLNLLIHNENYHPSPTKLEGIWKNLEEFMKIVLA